MEARPPKCRWKLAVLVLLACLALPPACGEALAARGEEFVRAVVLIKEGVRSYFAEFETDVKTDEALKDMLIGVEDINRIPLPSAAPYFTKEGLSFVYQQYEIAPYAAGMVSFNIPYAKIRPFLTKDASALVNDN